MLKEEHGMDKIQATIQEDNDGAHYHVLLQALPNKGDKLSLFSHLDQASGPNASHEYLVKSITHEVHDVSDTIEESQSGFHTVTILVTPT